MVLFEEKLIFIPKNFPDDDWKLDGLEHEDVHFTASDGTKLHGWYIPHPQPKAVVLFAHGNAGNITHRELLLRAMHNRLKLSVLIFDYRGYGHSEGSPTERGVLDDARAARTWLAQKTGLKETDLVLMGESLGGAVAVDLAADGGARGLILENTFTSLPEVGAYHYSWLPVRLFMRSKLDSLSKIGKYHGPLLMVHGNSDTIVPIAFGRRLFEAANEPKQLVVIPHGNHNDGRTPTFYTAAEKFLDTLPGVQR